MAKRTRGDLLIHCTLISKQRPELSRQIDVIYQDWIKQHGETDDQLALDYAFLKIDELVDATTIEDVTDIFN